ncbi:hypothetical protein J6590_089135 [Homalodisca vitripennis]|nr:hypothetical protein J6590_089135 [Homalodisca vitripennis]
MVCNLKGHIQKRLQVFERLSLSSTMDTADSFVSSVLFSPVCPHSSPVQYHGHSGFICQPVLFSPVCPHSSPVQYIADSFRIHSSAQCCSAPVCPHSSPVQYIADSFVSSVLFSPCLFSQLPCPVHNGFIRQLSVVQPLSRIHLSAQCCSALSVLTAPLSSTMDTADSFVSSVLFSPVCPHSTPVQYIADSSSAQCSSAPVCSPSSPV